jgi:hypothetical protein
MNTITTRLRAHRKLAGLLTAAAAVILFIFTGASACSSGSGQAQSTESGQAAAGINLILSNQPVPIFPTSELRRNLTEVEAIQALGTPTTSFFFAPGAATAGPGAHPIKVCTSQGEPIHATDELSNPQQTAGYQNDTTIGQMDPNGIYAGDSSGTYVLCLDASGTAKMAYWEGDVETESGTAVWNSTTGMIQDVGPSQLPVCSLKTAQSGDGTNLKAGTSYYHCVEASGS